jgi:hypothetical protein
LLLSCSRTDVREYTYGTGICVIDLNIAIFNLRISPCMHQQTLSQVSDPQAQGVHPRYFAQVLSDEFFLKLSAAVESL